MKSTFILISLFTVWLLFSQNGFKIHGKIEGETNGKVKIFFLPNSGDYLKVKLNNGEFIIEGQLKRETQAVLTYKDLYSRPFYIENSEIKVVFYKDTNEKVKSNHAHKNMLNIKTLQGSMTENLAKDYSKFRVQNIQKDNYKYLIFNYLKEKISRYPSNYLYVDLINQISKRQEYLSYAQLMQLLDSMDLFYLDDNSKFQLTQNLEKADKFSIGRVFPEKYATDLNGDAQLLSESYGKYTLIDFWASWCKPCRKKNPEIKKIYQKYNSKGFNVIGISSDKLEEKWRKAIQKDGLPWSNFISAKLYKEILISSIPYTFLIDEQGKIVGVNLKEEKIEAFLTKNL